MEKRFIIYGGAILLLTIISAVALLLWFFVFNSYDAARIPGPKLVIDHDGGADDAMAIFLALLYEKYFDGPKVIGLTTTHGNVNESQSFYNSQRILNVADRRDVPIYRGSSHSLVLPFESDYYFGYDGLGDNPHEEVSAIKSQPEHAALALIELSKKHPGQLVVVAIGPVTNIAMAIRLDPEFIGRLSHLYVAAGHVYSANYTEAEFNALMDVESYHIVADNSNSEKVTVIPFSQIMETLTLPKTWRENVLGEIATSTIEALNSFERVSMGFEETDWVLLDPAAILIALNDDMVQEVRYSNNSIILCGNQRGVNTNDYSDVPDDANVKLVYSANIEVYKELLVNVFSAELK